MTKNTVLDTGEQITRLTNENLGMRAKLQSHKRFRANYQAMKKIYKMELECRAKEKRQFDKAVRALTNIANYFDNAQYPSMGEIVRYARKMLDIVT